MIRVRPHRSVLALLMAALAPSLVFADGSFARWRLLFKGEDGSKAYYYAASIKSGRVRRRATAPRTHSLTNSATCPTPEGALA